MSITATTLACYSLQGRLGLGLTKHIVIDVPVTGTASLFDGTEHIWDGNTPLSEVITPIGFTISSSEAIELLPVSKQKTECHLYADSSNYYYARYKINSYSAKNKGGLKLDGQSGIVYKRGNDGEWTEMIENDYWWEMKQKN